MLFVFPIFAVLLGSALAYFTQEELQEGKKFLKLFSLILLTYLIFFLILGLEINPLNILAIILAAVIGLLLPYVKSHDFVKEEMSLILLLNFSKGILFVLFSNSINFFYPLILQSLLEGSLSFKSDKLQDLNKIAFSQASFLIGILVNTLFKSQILAAFSIGCFVVVLGKKLFPEFMQAFEPELLRFYKILK